MDRQVGAEVIVTGRGEEQRAAGRAIVRRPARSIAHVQTVGFMGGALVDETLSTVNRLLDDLGPGVRREVFMDHSRVTGIRLAIVMISLRWLAGLPRPRTIHVRLEGLPAVLRVWMWLLYPLMMVWDCEYHSSLESFEARLDSAR